MARFDIAVVGAGIVGLSVARELLSRRPGASLVVIDKEPRVGAHQTGHNSGVIHGGIYYEPGSLKARLCVEGAAMMYEYAAEHAIPHERCGKLIVAVNGAEIPRLDALENRGSANKVPGLRRVGAGEIRDIEPNANGIAALHAPNTGIVDYGAVVRAIEAELAGQGVSFLLNTSVDRIREGSPCRVITDRAEIAADQVVVCAGLWSDRLAKSSGADASPRILPFRGVYLRLKPEGDPVVRGMIYPVPDPELPFLGVHITKDTTQRVLLGPTAMLVPARDGYRFRTVRGRDVWETGSWPGTWKVARKFWRTGLNEMRLATSKRAFVESAAQYVPSLTVAQLDNGFYSGVRAQAVDRSGNLVDDFAISHTGSIAHVRNAPSPAATSAFSLARELVDRIERV